MSLAVHNLLLDAPRTVYTQLQALPEGSKPIGSAASAQIQDITQFQKILDIKPDTIIQEQINVAPTPEPAPAPNFLKENKLNRAETILSGMHQTVLQKSSTIQQNVNQIGNNTSPVELIKLQQSVSEYTQSIDFITNITKKLTDTVSTLLRSQ